LLIEAAKEQQALIHQQQAQLQLQQSKIERLSRQVRAVQAAVKANGRAHAEVHTVKATAPAIHQ
jgi:Tfp pilus assembly protein FimV